MQPRLGTPRRQQARPDRPFPAAAPPAPAPSSPWRLTRRLNTAGRLALFRASAANELGPGCYVLKTAAAPSDAVARAMLHRVHAVSSDVTHPNLSSVLAADFTAPQPLVILPYLEGLNLRRLIASRRWLPTAYALQLARQIAAALAALHAAGWLHGQVRPEHIIVSPQAHATLIDLTLARRLDSDECGAAFLLPNDRPSTLYAAPESFSSRRRLTPAADTYSLGLVLFEVLAGQPPFLGNSLRDLSICHQCQAPPNIRQFRLGSSHEIDHLIRHMLAKEPLRRPTDDQLVRWLTELEIDELRAGP